MHHDVKQLIFNCKTNKGFEWNILILQFLLICCIFKVFVNKMNCFIINSVDFLKIYISIHKYVKVTIPCKLLHEIICWSFDFCITVMMIELLQPEMYFVYMCIFHHINSQLISYILFPNKLFWKRNLGSFSASILNNN